MRPLLKAVLAGVSVVAVCVALTGEARAELSQQAQQQLSALVAGDDVGLMVEAMVAMIEAEQATIGDIATYVGQNVPAESLGLVAQGLAAAYPDQIMVIVNNIVAQAPASYAEVVLGATSVLPAENQEQAFNEIIASLEQNVPALQDQPAFAALRNNGLQRAFNNLQRLGVPALQQGVPFQGVVSPN